MSGAYSIDPSLYADTSLVDDHASIATQAPAPIQAAPLGSLLNVPESEIVGILRKKRKAREHKACFPCRQRKVKCDLSRPCQTCRDRNHEELCTFEPESKRQAIDHPSIRGHDHSAALSASVTIPRTDFERLVERLSGLEQSLTELRSEVGSSSVRTLDPALAKHFVPGAQHSGRSHIDVHGLHQTDEAGTITHYAAGSIPAMLHALKYPEDDATQQGMREQLNRSIIPLFGLDSGSTTYPFIDLWGLPHGSLARVNELVKVLPDDKHMLALLRNYKNYVHITFPGLTDLDRFEEAITEFLVNRVAQQNVYGAVTEHSVYGKGMSWLGLLFAVAASGVQSSDVSRKQRELTSQVYVCCAAECLRISNFLARSDINTIQTLVILQNVLSNNMNASTAWAMGGLTIRLAQGQGFHQPCAPGTSSEHMMRRSRVWWSIIWQDSQLSLVYDRSGSDTLTCAGTMPIPTHFGKVSSFDSVMYRLAVVTHDIIRARICSPSATGSELGGKLDRFHTKIVQILHDASPHLQDARQCQSNTDSLEYWELFLQSSYVLAELCRPALDPTRDVASHRSLCIKSLVNTIEAWLGMQLISPFARQSWSAIHRALSAALLLGILGEHNANDLARTLLAKFVSVVSTLITDTEPAEVSGPLQRGINALIRLNLNEPAATTLEAPSNGLQIDPGILAVTNGSAADIPPHAVLNSILWGAEAPRQTASW